MPSENQFSDGILYGHFEMNYVINHPKMPDDPTPINTVTNIEKRPAAKAVNAMAISSCGLSDTK